MRYRTFGDFYPFYLSQHSNRWNRLLHFIGSWCVLVTIAAALLTQMFWLLVLVPFAGYGFAWSGHFFFEKNQPATFTYPLFSLAGDWVMFWHLLTGRLSF